MCIKIYIFVPSKFPLAPGLAWQAAFKKAKVKLDRLAEMDMLLMVEKGIEEKYITLFIDMQKLIINT